VIPTSIATKLPESLSLVVDSGRFSGAGMSYNKKSLLTAAVGALVLGTLVSWGALYELGRKPNSDSQTVGSAAFQQRP
jgi:hypothetical protein